MKKVVDNCFPLLYMCLQCDEVCIDRHFGAPGTSGFYVRATMTPKTMDIFIFFNLYFNSKSPYQIASMFDM